MSVPVRVTPAARGDILQAEQYFEGRRVGSGDEFVDEFLATVARIAAMPLGYGEVDPGVRAAPLGRFGYIAYYQTDGTEAEVIAVLHGGRSPAVWQGRVSGS